MVENDFRIAAKVGLKSVTVGIESGVERIRREMNKPYSNEELFTYLRYLAKYDIKVRASMIIGWFTETDEDFNETINFLKVCAEEKLIRKVSLGGTLTIGGLKEISPLLPMRKMFNDKLTFDEHGNWIYKNNTMKIRIKRWLKMRDECLKFGFITHEQKYTKMNKFHKLYYGEPLNV
jgi:hypothetical protein